MGHLRCASQTPNGPKHQPPLASQPLRHNPRVPERKPQELKCVVSGYIKWTVVGCTRPPTLASRPNRHRLSVVALNPPPQSFVGEQIISNRRDAKKREAALLSSSSVISMVSDCRGGK
ncbi:hypothetical protein GWK47_047821 [Chionoecetes opilio]|uniref:Uncharacterized protein n=1 Tax=Chionoecetes opilio TaxID=41210 RepID=A0A8J4Y552_CHIOP|nr:hypothetical protein GWK47_047821 [Chionoecetes opilio]